MEDKLRTYLKDTARTMQLATVRDGRPRVCTVWFVADEDMNLYWLSYPSREHSKDIAKDSNVAAAIVVKADEPTVGLQIVGSAGVVNDIQLIENVMERYQKKYQKGGRFIKNFRAGINEHQLYCLKPTKIALFDEQNFPGGEKQILKLGA
jgi:uncharacterized pyridoxamine 5'-phosphate oxidase family protein